MIVVERLRPGRSLPPAPGFIPRAVVLNGVQAGSVFLLGTAVDRWWSGHRLFDGEALGTGGGAALGYLAITFVYYWWHRARHEVPWLWRGVHQLHHSPARLEIITSFYKHPLEIGLNAVLSSAILYGVVGITPAAGAVAVLVTGLAELVYHWNVRTPRWLGFLFQRPEMHCVHHQRGRHTHNYGDLPLWDILFGTFENPTSFRGDCGFEDHREAEWVAMLRGVDVNAPATPDRGRWVANVVLVLGTTRMMADVAGAPRLGGVAAASGASPAPKVFTAFDGYEPFSTTVELRWQEIDGHHETLRLHPDGPRLRGAYNRRNAYGAVVVFMPVGARTPELAPMFRSVAHHALCGSRPLLRELGVDVERVASDVTVHYGARTNTPSPPPYRVRCAAGDQYDA